MGLDVETLEQSLDTIRTFASQHPLDPGAPERNGANGSARLARSLGEDGLELELLFLPPSAGGMGGDSFDIYRVCETIGAVDLELGTAIPGLAGCSVHDGQPAILAALIVAGISLGAGWSALERAILHSKETAWGDSTLSRDACFTHRLVVPQAAGLEAADHLFRSTCKRQGRTAATVW